MFALKQLRLAAGVTALAGLAACGGDSTGPSSVNTTTMTTSLNNLTATFTGNAAFQSLASLALAFPQYPGPAMLRAALPVSGPVSTTGGPWAEVRRERDAMIAASLMAPKSTEALFPANVLGKTLVWDTDSSKYVLSAVTGAPTNGIRIRLYSVNTTTQMPAVPLQLLGYVDLTDESTPQANKLGVLLKLGTTTIADYDITEVTGTTTSQFSMVGYIVNGDGSGRVDFNFQSTINTVTNASQFQATLTGQGGAQVVATLTDDGASNGTFLFRITQGGNSIEISAQDSGAASGTGQVKYNGTLVANITEDANGDPVFTGTNGHTLTNVERDNLLAIFGSGFEAVFFLFIGLLLPGIVVFGGIL